MKTSFGQARRVGALSARDALVFIVTVLMVAVLVEGIIIANASGPQGTYTLTSTVTNMGGGTGTDGAVTVTSTAAASTKTVTVTTTVGSGPAGTATSTVTSTTTVTTTVTSTKAGANFSGTSIVTIPAGAAASNGASEGYDPDTIVVVVGVNNTVTWINNDDVYHTVTSASVIEPFSSGQIAPGANFTYSFTTAGTYSYFDENYLWMSGQVTVEA